MHRLGYCHSKGLLWPILTLKVRNYVLFILTLVYAFNFIDRQIIGILSPFIKADLGLDDAQLGWLKGIYFALLYTVMGIPIAWLADRYSRVNIIAISLTLWSGFTAASGLAANYMQLAIARIGVGIGEAGGSPPNILFRYSFWRHACVFCISVLFTGRFCRLANGNVQRGYSRGVTGYFA